MSWKHVLYQSIFGATLVCGLVGCSREAESPELPTAMETVTIPLNSSVLREPLVSMVLPERRDQKVTVGERDGSASTDRLPDDSAERRSFTSDRVRFVKNGMLVTQFANREAPGRVTGFKLLVPAVGDFDVTLRCAIHRLDQPTKRGAHGLAMRFLFRDAETPMLMFGCMATQNHEQRLVKRIKRRGDDKPTQSMTPISFSAGAWSITRRGPGVTLEVRSEDGQLIASDFVDVGEDNLEATEVWCTRLPEGNGHAEIELRNVSVSATEFFPAEPEPRSYMAWIRVILLVIVIVSGGVAYWRRN